MIPEGYESPAGWAVCKLGDLMEVVRGASPRPKGDPRYFGGEIPWVTIRDVTSEPGRTLTHTREGVTEAGAQRSRLLPAGTLVLSNRGTVCVPKFLGVAGCIHDGFIAFPELPDGIDPFYVYEFFNWIRPAVINAHRQGVTQVNLNTSIVRDFVVPVAPTLEQRRIVNAIETQLSKLDAAVAGLECGQANLKRYRASVLKAAVEGRLVPTEAELARQEGRNYEPAKVLLDSILADRRRRWEDAELGRLKAKGKAPSDDRWKAKYKQPPDPVVAELPELSDGWCWATVGEICDADNGRAFKSTEWRESGTPIIRIENLKNSNARFNYFQGDLDDKHRVEHGDVLFAWSGTPGTSFGAHIWGGGAAALNQHIFNIRFDRKSLNAQYLKHALNENVRSYVQQAQGGVGLAHITKSKFMASQIPLVPRSEQERIVAAVDTELSKLAAAVAGLERGQANCERLRQSVLSWAFSGRLVDQDPTDESAQGLLHRIREQRQRSDANPRARGRRRRQ